MRAEELIKMIAAEIEVGKQGTIKSLLLQENWMWSLGGSSMLQNTEQSQGRRHRWVVRRPG